MPERTVEYDESLAHVVLPDLVDENGLTPPPTRQLVEPRRDRMLRQELSARNLERAAGGIVHEVTIGSTPAVVYQQAEDGSHGNFFPASYRRIVANPAWAERLEKAYTASRRLPYVGGRQRRELDAATSSDALLMNVFCHPSVLRSRRLHALLGVGRPAAPQFGVRTRVPLRGGHDDRTEVDMMLQGDEQTLLLEAKLTEGDFQTAREELMQRYTAFTETFDVEHLPRRGGQLRSYQLLRSVLAAQHLHARFAVLLDARRADLMEEAFLVYRAVQDAGLRSRLQMVTWQEVAACVPRTLQRFLSDKYGIDAAR